MSWAREFSKEHSKPIAATLLVSLITVAASWIFGLAWVGRVWRASVDYLSGDISIARFWLPFSFVAGLLLSLGVVLSRRFLTRDLDDYRRDDVLNAIWEWDDLADANSLTPVCRRCQAELFLSEKKGSLECGCGCCDFQFTLKGINAWEYKSAVKLEIERRERTGQWRGSWRRLRRLARGATKTPAMTRMLQEPRPRNE